jgi:hypothetical protein
MAASVKRKEIGDRASRIVAERGSDLTSASDPGTPSRVSRSTRQLCTSRSSPPPAWYAVMIGPFTEIWITLVINHQL